MTETICLFYVGILIKKNACPLLLPFCPLVCRLEQQVPGSYQQFLASVSICITEWFVGHSCKFGFFHFIVCLLDSIPPMFHPDLLHCISRQFLYVETAYHPGCFRKRGAYDFTHGIRQVQCHLCYGMTQFLVYLLQLAPNRKM